MTLDDSAVHPCNMSVNVYGIFDVCHMLKLVRNAFADLKVLIDDNGNEIRWAYMKNLLDVQENPGICAANKLAV